MLGTARDEAVPLLGRTQEQSLLTSLLDEVEDRGRALVLRGEPGIGKSRLLSVAARTASERGMTVLTAAGVQSEAHLPFAGLHQMLRPVRERAVGLPRVQRDALDAAFGLTGETPPEHYRIAMASLDLCRPRMVGMVIATLAAYRHEIVRQVTALFVVGIRK